MGNGNDTLDGWPKTHHTIQWWGSIETIIGGCQDTIAGAANDMIGLSAEVQEKTQALQTWIVENSVYAGIEKIQQNVSVHKDGLHIKTSLWVKTLAWRWYTSWRVDTLGANLKAQKYTIAELGAIMEALGGSTFELRDWYKIGSPDLVKFLNDIAGIKQGVYPSSSEFVDVDGDAPPGPRTWAIFTNFEGVFLTSRKSSNCYHFLLSQNPGPDS